MSASELVAELRTRSIETWRTGDKAGIDACAIEHMDDRSLAVVRGSGDLQPLDIRVPGNTAAALLVQLELPAGTTSAAAYDQIENALAADTPDSGLVRFCRLLNRFDLLDSTELAAPDDTRRILPAGVSYDSVHVGLLVTIIVLVGALIWQLRKFGREG